MPRIEEFDKEVVLENAMKLFWEKGFNGTSMQDLVDRTGLNRSSLYNSFGSKRELYKESLCHYQKQAGGIFQKAMIKASNPFEAIRFIFEAYLPKDQSLDAQKGCFVMNCKTEMANQDGDLQNWLLEVQDHSLNMFEELVRGGQELGLINLRESPKDYAYFLLSAFQGYRVTGILVKDRAVMQGIISQTLNAIS